MNKQDENKGERIMIPVEPKLNLRSSNIDNDTRRVSPADIYRIFKKYKDNDTFDIDHISQIARDVSFGVNDIIDGNQILYFDYDSNHGNTYKQVEYLERIYGDLVVRIDEMRDGQGYLKQFRVVLTEEK